MSRVGLKPIPLPDQVAIAVDGPAVSVTGPRGSLSLTLPEGVTLDPQPGCLLVRRATEQRRHRALHGTIRTLLSNMVTGVSRGFTKDLEIQGVGFRATVKGRDLDLSLGRSFPLLHPIPDGITVTVTDNTKIRVEGIDKQQVGQFAADVRAYHPPEPYKGKGVRYVGEYVRHKEGKTVGK